MQDTLQAAAALSGQVPTGKGRLLLFSAEARAAGQQAHGTSICILERHPLRDPQLEKCTSETDLLQYAWFSKWRAWAIVSIPSLSPCPAPSPHTHTCAPCLGALVKGTTCRTL